MLVLKSRAAVSAPASGDERGARLGGRLTSSGIKAGPWIRQRRTSLLVHVADGKQAFWGDGPVDRRVDNPAMREIGDEQVDRRPVCSALLSRPQRHRSGPISLPDRGDQQPRRECRLGDIGEVG
jgi:hypothetical protein